MSKSFFIVSREIFESAIWREDPHTLKLFLYLIGSARHKPEPKKYPGVVIQRGEVVTSLARIADDNEYHEFGAVKKWSRQKVMRMLEKLESGEYIKRISDTYGTHISICNYSTYQDVGRYKSDTDGTPAEHVWNAYGTPADITNNDNNGTMEQEDIGVPQAEPPVVSPKPKKPPVAKIKYAKHVRMTEAEYGKLVGEYGEMDALAFIERLNTYKGSTGKSYKSDYMTMHSWVIKAVMQDRKQPQRTNGKQNGRTYSPDPEEYRKLAAEYGIGDA